MPTDGEKTTRVTEDGVSQEVYTVEFTNGAVKQLEELKEYMKAKDLLEVLQTGIAFVQKLKEIEQKKAKEQPK